MFREEYKLIESHTASGLSSMINGHVKRGWRLVGNHIHIAFRDTGGDYPVFQHDYTQMMVKTVKVKEADPSDN